MSNRHWHTCLSRIRNSSTFNKDNTNSAANALALCHVKAAGKRAPRPWEMLQGKHCHGDEYLIQLAGIRTRDQAQTMRGASLYLRQEQQRIDPNDNENDNNNNNNSSNTKAPDEYLVADLVGLNVFLYQQPQPNDAESAKDNNDNDTPSEQYVGIVGGVAFAEDFCSIPGLGHDYIEVILPRGVGGVRTFWRDEMVLIPLVPQLVPIVNVDAGVIYIDPPSGLLDLSYVREDKTRIKGLLPPAADKQADSMETTA